MSEETAGSWGPSTIGGIGRRDLYKLAKPGRIVDPRVWNATQLALDQRRKR